MTASRSARGMPWFASSTFRASRLLCHSLTVSGSISLRRAATSERRSLMRALAAGQSSSAAGAPPPCGPGAGRPPSPPATPPPSQPHTGPGHEHADPDPQRTRTSGRLRQQHDTSDSTPRRHGQEPRRRRNTPVNRPQHAAQHRNRPDEIPVSSLDRPVRGERKTLSTLRERSGARHRNPVTGPEPIAPSQHPPIHSGPPGDRRAAALDRASRTPRPSFRVPHVIDHAGDDVTKPLRCYTTMRLPAARQRPSATYGDGQRTRGAVRPCRWQRTPHRQGRRCVLVHGLLPPHRTGRT